MGAAGDAPEIVARRFSLLDRTPLRVVLVAVVVALVGVGLFASGAAVTGTMRGQLIARVDADLREAADGWAHRPPPMDQGPPAGGGASQSQEETAEQTSEPGAGAVPGQVPPNRQRPPTQFYVAKYDAAGAVDLEINDNSAAPDTGDVAAMPVGTPVTVDSRRGSEVGPNDDAATSSWRVLVTESDAGRTVIALPLDEPVTRTVRQLILVQGVAGIIVITLVGGVGLWLVRRSMRPLAEVEAASADLAAGDLTRRLPPRPSNTEVGGLTGSFNEMASRIESAFADVRASEESARAAEESARSSEESARASEERMRRFIADAGHELRTPLTSIRGFADLYASGAIPADRAVDRIGAESRRMTSLVEDLLELARLDAMRPNDRAIVDVVSVVTESVATVAAIDPERSIDISATDAPQILGDADRLHQAVLNLLVNAVRHTPPGTDVHVSISRSSTDALITVADEGPGMSEEDAAIVFERFTRLDQSRTRGDGGGSGLGLSIADAIVGAHGGSIELATSPGAGAVFIIRIPALEPDGAA